MLFYGTPQVNREKKTWKQKPTRQEMTVLGFFFMLMLMLMEPKPQSSTPKMAGVFEVEVDGVEHHHGLEHSDDSHQVSIKKPPRCFDD